MNAPLNIQAQWPDMERFEDNGAVGAVTMINGKPRWALSLIKGKTPDQLYAQSAHVLHGILSGAVQFRRGGR